MKNGISTNRNMAAIAACLKQSGTDFVFRYYSQTTQQSEKRLTQTEAEALCAAGIQIGVVYEDGPTTLSYFSQTRGHLDGVNAYNFALNLHQPPGSAIYFAVDYDAALSDISGAILDYFQGVDQGLSDAGGGNNGYTIGVYGSGATCDFLTSHCPFIGYAWLAESTGWRGSRTYADWHVKQAVATTSLCGLSADDYEANQALDDFGGFTLNYVSALDADPDIEFPAPSAESPDHTLFIAKTAIADLNLSPAADAAAHILQSRNPSVLFTSGRRDAPHQAHAMAGNVVRNRNWIRQTYLASPERDALQQWVDSNPDATTQAAITDGLTAIMLTWTDDQKRQLSRHFSGQAFDVQPVAGPTGDIIKASIRSLPNLHKFLDTEGGLILWHAEFNG